MVFCRINKCFVHWGAQVPCVTYSSSINALKSSYIHNVNGVSNTPRKKKIFMDKELLAGLYWVLSVEKKKDASLQSFLTMQHEQRLPDESLAINLYNIVLFTWCMTRKSATKLLPRKIQTSNSIQQASFFSRVSLFFQNQFFWLLLSSLSVKVVSEVRSTILYWLLANVFPAGVANFGKAMYRALERSTQDTRDGIFLYSAQASFLGRTLISPG